MFPEVSIRCDVEFGDDVFRILDLDAREAESGLVEQRFGSFLQSVAVEMDFHFSASLAAARIDQAEFRRESRERRDQREEDAKGGFQRSRESGVVR